jgi:serine/threonine-protein kinase RsbW
MGALTTVRQTAQEQSDSFDVTMPKDPSLVAAIRLTAAAIGHHAGLSIDAIDDLKIMVAEACSYCIQRGGAGRLKISFIPEASALTLVIDDPDQTDATAMHPPGDFFETEEGLFIIKSLAESVDCQIDQQRGLRLTIRTSAG